MNPISNYEQTIMSLSTKQILLNTPLFTEKCCLTQKIEKTDLQRNVPRGGIEPPRP